MILQLEKPARRKADRLFYGMTQKSGVRRAPAFYSGFAHFALQRPALFSVKAHIISMMLKFIYSIGFFN